MRLPGFFILIALGLASLYPLQRWIDADSPRQVVDEETLYFASGHTIKKMSLGLDGLVADIYWIRTTQYFGRKALAGGGRTDVRMDLLAPLLNIIVDLDPSHIPAYRFGAIFLPEQDPKAAIDLLEKGIERNPGEWRLYQDLGFIYWHMGDYTHATEVYDAGSKVPGAIWWMRDLAAMMKLKGGSREAAREIYSGYLASDDRNIKKQALFRLKMLRSLDELDAVNALVSKYKSETGRCPANLRVLARWLEPAGIPLNDDLNPVDPDGFPYRLDTVKCEVSVAPNSDLPKTF
jgi:tetratricopeptide (TPR) repeat protein